MPVTITNCDTRCYVTFSNIMLFDVVYYFSRGTQQRSYLRRCSTSWKVAGSIPDGVIGIFHLHNPSGHNWVDSASKRNVYQEYLRGGRGRHLHALSVLKSGNLKLLEPSGPVQGLLCWENCKCAIPVVCVRTGKGIIRTKLCQLRCFHDYTRQLHVSAPTGLLQVVFKILSCL